MNSISASLASLGYTPSGYNATAGTSATTASIVQAINNLYNDRYSSGQTAKSTELISDGYLKPSGTKIITDNGSNIDVSNYKYANVSVSVPSGYIKPSGNRSITSNGDYNVTAYEEVTVNVPVPSGYIQPSGTKSITSNGNGLDVTNYQYVNVNVPTGITPSGTKSITSNGSSIDVSNYKYVNVNVPVPSGYVNPSGTKTITSNGSSIDVSSYKYVDVDVPTGTTPSGTKSITSNGTYDVGSYKYASVNVASTTPTINLCSGMITNSKLDDSYYTSTTTLNKVLSGSGCFNTGTATESSASSAAKIEFNILQAGTYYVKIVRRARNVSSSHVNVFITPSGGSRTSYTSTLLTEPTAAWVEHTFAANDLLTIQISTATSNANYVESAAWTIMKK